MPQAELFLKAGAQLAEGPVYDPKADVLYWVDIDGRQLHCTELLSRKDQSYQTPSRVGMMRLMEDGEICVALEDGLYQKTKSGYSPLAILPKRAGMRSNDGNCDAKGRLWLGTMDLSGKTGGSLFRIEQGKVTEMVTGVSCSNGLCFSHDNHYLYYIDTPSGKLWRFDFDLESGQIENRIGLIDYTEEQGNFDGMTIDAQGQLWVAHWGGWKVSAWDPQTGKKQEEIAVPAPNVSCCTFGGKDFNKLYISTAYTQGVEGSGALYVCEDTGCKGMEFVPYRP